MKKLVTRLMVLCTLCVCLGVLSSTSISARPPAAICQSQCFGYWIQCETVLSPDGRCVPTICSYNFACLMETQDTLEQPETEHEGFINP